MTSAAKANRRADIVDRLEAEIERLRSALDTCRELREFDAEEIARLRALNIQQSSGERGNG